MGHKAQYLETRGHSVQQNRKRGVSLERHLTGHVQYKRHRLGRLTALLPDHQGDIIMTVLTRTH